MASRPASYAERILRERGEPSEPVVLPFPGRTGTGDPHRWEQPPPPDGPEVPFYPDDYTTHVVKRSGSPPRLWLKGRWRQVFPSIPWNPLPAIVADLDRETRSIPQAIDIVSMRGSARIEGFHLDGLAERLNEQHVVKIFAYCPVRWPGKAFGPGEAIVTSIRWTWLEER